LLQARDETLKTEKERLEKEKITEKEAAVAAAIV